MIRFSFVMLFLIGIWLGYEWYINRGNQVMEYSSSVSPFEEQAMIMTGYVTIHDTLTFKKETVSVCPPSVIRIIGTCEVQYSYPLGVGEQPVPVRVTMACQPPQIDSTVGCYGIGEWPRWDASAFQRINNHRWEIQAPYEDVSNELLRSWGIEIIRTNVKSLTD